MRNDAYLEIPAGWAQTTISEVTEESIEQGAPEGSTEFLYIDISSIDNKSKKITNPKKLSVAEAPSRAKQHLLPGDVLVSMTRPNLNAVALLPESMSGAIGSTGFHVLRTKWILPSWLFYLVQTSEFVEAMSELVQGALYPAIRPRDIKSYRIPIAPLNEQRRIVDELEKQLTRLDSAVADIKRVQTNLSRYRAVVIDTACKGQLVPTEAALSKENEHSYEPANVTLARLLDERRAKWEADQLAKMQEKGKSPKNDRWKANYHEPATPSIDNLPELPEGWTWATVDQLAALEPNSITDGPFGSNLKSSHYRESGPRVIRLQNIGDGEFIDIRAHISVEHFETLKKHQVEAGDLVIAALGERPPRACIIPESVVPAIVKADCIRFKPETNVALPEYLNYALNAESTRKRTASAVHGVGRPRLNLGEIKAIALPLPPIAEQHRIVAEVERRVSVFEKLKALVQTNLLRSETLRQKLFQQAFQGKLVPQDPNDEPASVLLERIRAAKVDAGKEMKSARKDKRREMSAKSQRKKEKQIRSVQRRPLREVVEADKQLTPEELFAQAGFTPEFVEEFYEELREEVDQGRIKQERPNNTDVYLKATTA